MKHRDFDADLDLDGPTSDTADLPAIADVAARIPKPADLPPGAWVRVASSPPRSSWLGRVVGRKAEAPVHLASRCTALVALGYVEVAAVNGAAVGRAPMPTTEAGRSP